jgi:predicted aspartyl protease
MTAATLSPSSVKTRFRLAGGVEPLILLPVQVNGRGPFDFILDTGAGTSLLSSELAERLGVKITGSKEGQSAAGKVAVSLAKVSSFAIGSTRLDDVDVGIVDLSQIAKTIGANVDGDLGYNFLRYFRVTLDYRNYEIRLDDPKKIEPFGTIAKTEAPIRLANPAKPLILVDIYANGRGPFQFAVDTGTSTTAITPELAKTLGVKNSPVGAITAGSGYVDVTTGSLPSFQLGGARIDNLTVIVANFFEMLNQAVGVRLDGIVGYNFLRDYKVVIDYPGELLSLY